MKIKAVGGTAKQIASAINGFECTNIINVFIEHEDIEMRGTSNDFIQGNLLCVITYE